MACLLGELLMSPSLGNGSVPKRSLCFMPEMQGLMLTEAQHSVCVWLLNLHFQCNTSAFN